MGNLIDKKNAATFLGWGIFLLCLIIIDQWSKSQAVKLFLNNNFAFSLPLPPWLMYAIYLVVLASLVYYAAKNYKTFNFFTHFGVVLIFAGAISNIGERLFWGHVRDFIFINFYRWQGVYNLADFYILLGIIILVIPRKTVNKI